MAYFTVEQMRARFGVQRLIPVVEASFSTFQESADMYTDNYFEDQSPTDNEKTMMSLEIGFEMIKEKTLPTYQSMFLKAIAAKAKKDEDQEERPTYYAWW